MLDVVFADGPAPVARRERRFPERYLALALAGILGAVGTTSLGALFALGVLPASQFRTRSAARRFGRRSAALALVGVPAVLLRVVCTHGVTWFAWGPLRITHEGRLLGATTALRMGVAALFTSWLLESLTPRELDSAFIRLGTPPALVELTRQTRVFTRQLGSTLASAWAAAALRAGLSSPRALRRTVGFLAGVLVTRALDRADRVATARAVRGHGGSAS